MALSSTPVYAQIPKAWGAAIINATGAWTISQTSVTNLLSLVPGGINGAKVEAINVTTSYGVASSLYLVLNDGTNNYILSEFAIAVNAGTSTVIPSVSLLNNSQLPGLSYDPEGNKFLYVPAGATLYVGLAAAVGAGFQVSAVAFGSAF